MVKRTILCFLLFLSMISIGFAETNNQITYNIIKDSVIVDHIINFSDKQERIELIIPKDALAIEIKNFNFTIEEKEDYNIIVIENAKDIHIKYISDFFVEKTKERFFTINLGGIEGTKDINVILPEHAYLKYVIGSQKASLVPMTEDIRTDGKRIKIHWDKKILENSNSLLIIYGIGSKGFSLLWIILLILVFGIILFSMYFFLGQKFKKELARIKKTVSSEDITKNLFDEEKKIVEILLDEKGREMWQRQLILKSGLSKVKLSRKLRNLEYKGIVEKIPYGNTNKIRIKR